MSWMSIFLKLIPIRFAWSFSFASIIILTLGCHPLGGRWRGAHSAVDPAADDDWAPPKTSGYAQPKQYSHRTKPISAAEPPASKASKMIQPAEYQSPSHGNPSEKLPNSDNVVASLRDEKSQSPNLTDIRETDDQALDVEGAIAALPPNLQEVARRQLEAINNSRADSGEKSDSQPNNEVIASKRPSAKLSDVASIAQVTLDSPKRNDTKPRTSISAKITDQNTSEVVLASAQEVVPKLSDSAKSAPPVTKSEVEEYSKLEANSELPSANLHWTQSVSEAISKLERSLEEQPPQDENVRLSQELTLRWLYLSNRQLNEAMRPIEGLDEHEQEFFRYQVQALHEAGNPDAMPSKIRRWSLVMNSQRQATNHLAAASNLEVRSLAFCTDVQGYGVLTKFPNYQFKPDQEILLYCELDNVFAEQIKAGFETQLQGTYEIIDPNGRRVADQLLPMEREICQNHRRDYFIIYHIFMPMQIAPGNYQMRVTIEDMKARKFGQSTLDFQIQK